MCDVLEIPRSTYYYQAQLREEAHQVAEEHEIAKLISTIFKDSRNNYGTRKIKKELEKQGEIVSRRRIGSLMK